MLGFHDWITIPLVYTQVRILLIYRIIFSFTVLISKPMMFLNIFWIILAEIFKKNCSWSAFCDLGSDNCHLHFFAEFAYGSPIRSPIERIVRKYRTIPTIYSISIRFLHGLAESGRNANESFWWGRRRFWVNMLFIFFFDKFSLELLL